MASLPQYVGANWVESEDSPRYTFGEKAQMVRQFKGPWATAVTMIPPRGTWEGFYKVVGGTLNKSRGEQGVLVVNYECAAQGGAGTDPVTDKWRCEELEVNPPLARHPKFSALTADKLDNAAAAVKGADDAAKETAQRWITSQHDAVLDKYVSLLKASTENFYRSGLTYTWVSQSYALPALTMGGYIQSPLGPGAIYLPANFSWLRLADLPDYDGQRYTVTRRWKGAGDGHWDSYLYGA